MPQTLSEPPTLTSCWRRAQAFICMFCWQGDYIIHVPTSLKNIWWWWGGGFVSEKDVHKAVKFRMDASSRNLVGSKVIWCHSAHNNRVQASKVTFDLNAVTKTLLFSGTCTAARDFYPNVKWNKLWSLCGPKLMTACQIETKIGVNLCQKISDILRMSEIF